jgi:citrate lyase subunit beta / citryl-CoA lyase
VAPLIESAAGLRSAGAFLSTGEAQGRTIITHLGEVDLLADLGGRLPAGEELLHHAQHTLIFLVASQGGHAPIGGVHTDINNLETLRSSSLRLSQLGFGGRALIHPSHCDITNEAFTPTPEEQAWAHAVIAQMSGQDGAVRGADGTMLDEAVVRRARSVLSRVRR